MGLFKGLFGKNKEEEVSITQYAEDKYRELITFINFALKIKSQADGNYGIKITYQTPENYNSSSLYATFEFYDFINIYTAHQFAVESNTKMVEFIYHKISEEAGLTRLDWPYGIYACDFIDVLRGTNEYFTLLPDKYDDDIFTFRSNVGWDRRNAAQVLKTVTDLLKTYFPELKIEHSSFGISDMYIRISI